MSASIPHGGSGNGYSYYGCRCKECTGANRRRTQARKLIRRAYVQEHGLPPTVAHGYSAYINWGCRCDVCTAANTAICRAYHARVKAAS